jgi:hypothetical protein
MMWMIPFASTTGAPAIDEYAINADGTLNTTPVASISTGNSLLGLDPGQAPFSYAVDITNGNIFAYSLTTEGMLSDLGSFAGPAIPAGSAVRTAVFPPEDFTDAPVALFAEVENRNASVIPTNGDLPLLYPLTLVPIVGTPLPGEDHDFPSYPLNLLAEVENQNAAPSPFFSGGTVNIYRLGREGLPLLGLSPTVIQVPFAEPETYLILKNGIVLAGRF